MFRLGAAVAALLLLATFASGATWGAEADAPLVIVGYDPARADAATLAIQAAGGEIRRSSPELGFSVVAPRDPATFDRLMSANPAIQYREKDDPTRLAGGQWNGAQWNGAQWNGGQWNGGQWNGAQWNGAQWNGGQWNGAQWNAAQRNAFQWSVAEFRSSGGGIAYDLATTDPGIVWQWGAWDIRAPQAWQTTEGTSTATLCVLDSGVSLSHPDIAPNLWTGPLGEHGVNVLDPTATPDDDAGHGTHIAGIAAARVGNAYGVAGIGNARIMAVKVLDREGNGLEDQLAIGIAWCATHGADVAVMALSVTQPGPSLDRAIQFATDRDVLLLASAGNAGPCTNCVAYPARDPRVLAVSAVDGTGALAPFSSAGPEVDIAAPGVDVLGPFPGDRFAFGSGTSQAVAFAAGTAALLRDAHPGLSAQQTRALLTSTAHDIGPTGSDASFGHGLLTTDAALAASVPT
ncbi:MAG TPA: S8 family serine peptidase [Candidatus Thermoplasmatota archaeon]|nr:S8 family serine peptidase [Candidatus Thermoplasmatota archaeon]